MFGLNSTGLTVALVIAIALMVGLWGPSLQGNRAWEGPGGRGTPPGAGDTHPGGAATRLPGSLTPRRILRARARSANAAVRAPAEGRAGQERAAPARAAAARPATAGASASARRERPTRPRGAGGDEQRQGGGDRDPPAQVSQRGGCRLEIEVLGRGFHHRTRDHARRRFVAARQRARAQQIDRPRHAARDRNTRGRRRRVELHRCGVSAAARRWRR